MRHISSIACCTLVFGIAAAVHAQTTNYVARSGQTPVAPYTSWATAASNIQDAVDNALPGSTVLVFDGIYGSGGGVTPGHSVSNRVVITNSIVVRSLNGPEVTIIRGAEATGGGCGADAVRCVFLTNGVLQGFTLTNGHTMKFGAARDCAGGGVYADGGTVRACIVSGNKAYTDGGGTCYGTITNCTVTGNSAEYGGGSCRGTVIDCVIRGNAAELGGGVCWATVQRCRLGDNSAVLEGGGAYYCNIRNSAISGNAADLGGGTAGGNVDNCTITGNTASHSGGGTYKGTVNNSIIYYNSSLLSGPNIQASMVEFSCSPDLAPEDGGNIIDAPMLISVSHAEPESPCRAAGTDARAAGTDIDGDAWLDPPSMGCDEYHGPGTATGALQVIVRGPTEFAATYAAVFRADIRGRVTGNTWDFGDGTVLTNTAYPSHSWSAGGDYDVVLTAFSDEYPEGVSATQTVQVLSAAESTIYVSVDTGSDVNSGTNWGEAKKTIQAGVDSQNVVGGIVLVTNGVYDMGRVVTPGGVLSNRVVITKNIRVLSVNGPTNTIIKGAEAEGGGFGADAVRCLYIADGVLSGFTLTNGYTMTSGVNDRNYAGGGVLAPGGVVADCIITGNAAKEGGGTHYGVITNCTIRGNAATLGGGTYMGQVSDCVIVSNTATDGGGTYYGTISGCVIEGNEADYGGGTYGSGLSKCVVVGNTAFWDGGGTCYGTVKDCLVTGNDADWNGGGTYEGTLRNCTISDNYAGAFGGGACWGMLNNCIVYYNTALFGNHDILSSTARYSCSTDLTNGVDGNITAPPVFVNGLAGNYHLVHSSPCIDAGVIDPSWPPNPVDLDGNSRVFNGAVDMGAYEFTMTTRPKLFLQGPYSAAADAMTVGLRAAGYIPVSSPYAADVRDVDAVPTNAVDWVLLQLLDTNNNSVVAAKSCFLGADGWVMADTGQPGVRLEARPGYYYLAAKHRNHLAVVSADPVAFTNTTVVFDFTASASACRGGTNATLELEPGVRGLIAGDADGNGRVQWVDESVSTNQDARSGYYCGDFDLDGTVLGDAAALCVPNLGRATQAPRGEVRLWPSLNVTPSRKTLFSGDFLPFSADGSSNAITWFFTDIPSDGSNVVSGADTTIYYAGVSNGCIDVLEAWDGDNMFGRAYVNVISTNDAAQAGKAVIIAGWKSANDPLWDATDYLADNAYNTLLYRGYSKANVQYLSPVLNQDPDGNGAMDDIDLESTAANTEFTFTNWVNNANRLFLYLVDHGGDSSGDGYFVLNGSEKLWATNLNAWLDDLQNTYTTEVTVVIDCCYAASMLDELTNYPGPAKRIVIAAAGSDEPAYFVAGGLVSFSDAFFSGIMLGLDVADSYDMAASAMATYQTSEYGDNGGGSAADGLYLGASYLAGKDIPQIGSACGDQLLMDETTATLWADDIVSAYSIKRVWCVIIPPDHDPDPAVPISDVTEIELAYSYETGRYEADYGGFNEPGSYRVAYYARDIWNGVSTPLTRYVVQLGYDERIILVNGCDTNSVDWTNMNYVANHAYSMLLKRRFGGDDIYYVSADVDQDVNGDGTNDVDALPSLSVLSNAITNWAATTNFGGPADKLTVYLLGEGVSNTLRVGAAEYLTAEVLDDDLDVYQTNGDINVVMDFAGAGSFIKALTTVSNRLCLASCEADSPASFEQNGTVSFSHFFMSYISQGYNVGYAFSNARKYVRRATKRIRQNALLDDNGDGVANEKGQDGLVALTTYIGSAFLTGDDEVPVVGAPMTNQVLSGSNSLLLWVADITDADGISNVWCVVTPPDYDGSNDLERVDLAWNDGTERYEGLYTNFVEHGTWFLTFHAEDNNGDISTPVQTEIVKRPAPAVIHGGNPDEYEVDDTSTNASMYTSIRLHNFHTSVDVDWVKFYGQTNYAMEVSTVQLSTNMDIVLDLYFQDTNGTLTHLDRSDSLYPDDDEYLYIAAPTSGWYFVKVSQYGVANWTPGTYELSIYLPLGGVSIFVMAADALIADAMPAGPQIVLEGTNYAFDADNMTRFFLDTVPEKVVSVGITNLPAGYWAVECTNLANQSQNPDNMDYGNPRNLDMSTETYRAALFQFVPLLTAQATVRDQWTGERLEDVSVVFTAQSGRDGILGRDYEEYPDGAVYASNWLTSVSGEFPTNVLLPTVDWNLTLSVAGYPDVVFTNVILTTNAGATVDLGTVYLTAVDTNSNEISDEWEDVYFGVGSNVIATADADGDGLCNRDEYRLGTHPKDAGSRLGFDLEPQVSSNAVEITWPVVEGRLYRLRGCDDLVSSNWPYSAGPWEAAAGQTNMSHTVVTNAPCGFYRIQALLP